MTDALYFYCRLGAAGLCVLKQMLKQKRIIILIKNGFTFECR